MVQSQEILFLVQRRDMRYEKILFGEFGGEAAREDGHYKDYERDAYDGNRRGVEYIALADQWRNHGPENVTHNSQQRRGVACRVSSLVHCQCVAGGKYHTAAEQHRKK